MLYTILHSSVVFFAVVISVLVLGARVTRQQLGGAAWSNRPSRLCQIWTARPGEIASEGLRLLYVLGRRGLTPQTSAGNEGSSATSRPSRLFAALDHPGGAALVVFGLLATAVQSTVKVALFTEPQLTTSSSGCIWMEAWGCPPHQTHRCCCGRCCCDRHR